MTGSRRVASVDSANVGLVAVDLGLHLHRGCGVARAAAQPVGLAVDRRSVCTRQRQPQAASGAHSPAAYGVSTGPTRSQLNSAAVVALSNQFSRRRASWPVVVPDVVEPRRVALVGLARREVDRLRDAVEGDLERTRVGIAVDDDVERLAALVLERPAAAAGSARRRSPGR